MKICFLAHNLKEDNGAGVFSRTLIEYLRSAFNAEVSVITTEKSDYPYEHVLCSGSWYSWRFFRIRRLIKEADIVHALDAYPYGMVAAVCSLGLKKRFIVTAAGTGAIYHLYKVLYRPLLTWAYRKADQVTAISNFTKQEIQKRISGLPIAVINHGVSPVFFENVVDEAVLKKVAVYKPYVVSVGSLRFRKGYRWSIPAFAKVKARLPKMRYVIVGKKYSASEFNALKKIARDHHVEDSVVFLDTVTTSEELRAVYQQAEAFFLLSQNEGHDVEGFGLVFLEAAASGLPVVGSQDCGVEDAVEDGKNGYLVPSKDIDACASRLIEILDDKEKQAQMKEASRDFARRSTWEKRVAEYVSLYKRII